MKKVENYFDGYWDAYIVRNKILSNDVQYRNFKRFINENIAELYEKGDCVSKEDILNNLVSEVFEERDTYSDLYIKYYLKKSVGENITVKHVKARQYIFDDILNVCINSNIYFSALDISKKYISSSWGFTDNEIISDLTEKTVPEFNKKYKSFWWS